MLSVKRPRGSLLHFRDEYEYSIIGTYSVSKLAKEEVLGDSAASPATATESTLQESLGDLSRV